MARGASRLAALKKESDIAVGNAVGSNIFNMVFVALVSLPVFYIDNRISGMEGALLLGYYVLCATFIVAQAAGSSALPGVKLFAAFFIPITFVALVAFAVRSSRARRNTKPGYKTFPNGAKE